MVTLICSHFRASVRACVRLSVPSRSQLLDQLETSNFFFDSSRGLDLPICKIFLVGPPGGGGGTKKGFFPYKIQSMACDMSKYNEIWRRIRWCTSEEQLDQFFFFFLRSNKRVTRKYPRSGFYTFFIIKQCFVFHSVSFEHSTVFHFPDVPLFFNFVSLSVLFQGN